MFDKYLNEEVTSLTFDLKADLEPLMTWNTNIVFLSLVATWESNLDASKLNTVTVWDTRIPRTDDERSHAYSLDLENEYFEYWLSDINRELKGKTIKFMLRWEEMSTVGTYYADMIEVGSYRMPNVYYKSSGSRKYRPGPSNRPVNY